MDCRSSSMQPRRAGASPCYGGDVTVQVEPAARRGLLVAAEGIDGSGTSEGIDSLARWLERRGHRVRVVSWQPSSLVARAAASGRGRRLLTPRVAALLASADAARRITREIEPALARGDVVLCDRYAWTAAAREIARGLDAAWISALYRFAPRPDLVILHRQSAAVGLAHAMSGRPAAANAEALAGEFKGFLERMAEAYESFADGAVAALPDRGRLGPWPADVVALDAGSTRISLRAPVRDALARLFARAPARTAS
jgi:thymidylate kinase